MKELLLFILDHASGASHVVNETPTKARKKKRDAGLRNQICYSPIRIWQKLQKTKKITDRTTSHTAVHDFVVIYFYLFDLAEQSHKNWANLITISSLH